MAKDKGPWGEGRKAWDRLSGWRASHGASGDEALAALADVDFLERSYRVNRDGYRQLTAAFEATGVRYIPSFGNFVLFRAGDDEHAGARVNLALLKRGVIVRPVTNYGLPQWLRVSIGTEAENATFLAELPSAMGSAPEQRAAA